MSDRREAGAVLVVTALAMTGLLIVMALVIDLGSTRNIRSNARSAADAGSTAGALGLSLATSTVPACQDAFSYTYTGLRGTQPSASDISTACAPLVGPCPVGGPARTAILTVGSTVVRVTNPVPDGHDLMRGTALGARPVQALDAVNDGTACERVAVEVTRPHSKFFGGIVSDDVRTFTVHSVARYSLTLRPGEVTPALVALNQSACRAIDAGNNGTILLGATANGPGIALSDSDGPSCSSSNPIFNSTSSANLIAESSGATPGQLAWYAAPAAQGWTNCGGTCAATLGDESSSANYVGVLSTRPTRTTRTPMDQRYRCTTVPATPTQPVCAAAADPVTTALGYAASATAPPGFTTWPGPCETSDDVNMGGVGAQIWVNCDEFEVKGDALHIAAGSTIVFRGKLTVAANGVLLVNVTEPWTVDASGHVIASSPSLQTMLVVGSTADDAFSVQSTSPTIEMAQTTVVSRGGFDLQGSPLLNWTAPTTGPPGGCCTGASPPHRSTSRAAPRSMPAGRCSMAGGRSPLLEAA